MKFCKICKKVALDDASFCPECRKKLCDITDINEPVRLCVTGSTERAMICGLLRDNDIPFQESNVYPQGLANDIVTGYDVKLSNISILIPFSALPKASPLLSSLETTRNDVEPIMDEINAAVERLKTGKKEEKKMSPALRTTIKVITALLFLALIAAAVFATDAFTGFIKGLFGG